MFRCFPSRLTGQAHQFDRRRKEDLSRHESGGPGLRRPAVPSCSASAGKVWYTDNGPVYRKRPYHNNVYAKPSQVDKFGGRLPDCQIRSQAISSNAIHRPTTSSCIRPACWRRADSRSGSCRCCCARPSRTIRVRACLRLASVRLRASMMFPVAIPPENRASLHHRAGQVEAGGKGAPTGHRRPTHRAGYKRTFGPRQRPQQRKR